MTQTTDMPRLSLRRADLASFEHAYAVALRIRQATGRHQLVLRTGNPLQPFRTGAIAKAGEEQLIALIV